MNTTKKYSLPSGYSFMETMLHSGRFLKNPIKFITESMNKFSGTYISTLGVNRKLILTQDGDFINHVLKDNNRNYHKSEFSTKHSVELFGNGLLFSNGDYWLRQRRLLQPGFHKEKLKGLYDIIIKSIDGSLASFTTGEVDVYPLINQLSFNIIIHSLFDIRLSPQIMDELNRIFTEMQDFLITDINQPFRKIFYPITGTKKVQLHNAKRLREIFMQIIIERKTSNKTYADLLDMLLNSRYEDTGEPMTNDQLIDELVILVFAGHETTANTLSWLLYLLSVNENCYQKLLSVINSIDIYDTLSNDYIRATINESMRLYPACMDDGTCSIGD
jgi:cytochrome P450